MKKIYRNSLMALTVSILIISFVSCQKNDYYLDSGTLNPHYSGSVMEYLESKPGLYDSLVKVIRLAGMEDVFQNDSITFFAPADTTIIKSVDRLNEDLYRDGLDTISDLSQISSKVWEKELSLYLFNGVHLLDSYPQVKLDQNAVFTGQFYRSYDGRTMNVGVIFDDAGGVKYAGYRHLVISYIPSIASPLLRWFSTQIASSDIQPTNGVVHALRFGEHYFGFDVTDFVNIAKVNGAGKR